ncbi:MAG TPA: OmpH family outer membrane protein, partial [Bacteroidia bacterium]
STSDKQKHLLDSVAFELQMEDKALQSSAHPDKNNVLDFMRKKDEYTDRLKKFQKDNDEITHNYNQQILSQMNQYVQDYGKENGFTYIFGNDNNGSLMYAQDAQNVTKEVIKYLNQHYAGKK